MNFESCGLMQMKSINQKIILKAREENWVNVFNAFYRKAKEKKVFT